MPRVPMTKPPTTISTTATSITTTTTATPEGSDNDHLGADLDATVKVDHVLVAHPDAAGRDLGADGPGLVRAVDAVERRTEIHRARAERIVGTAGHVARQIGSAPEHLVGRRPIRPFTLHGDVVHARPGEAGA